jgi:hypothetical protein
MFCGLTQFLTVSKRERQFVSVYRTVGLTFMVKVSYYFPCNNEKISLTKSTYRKVVLGAELPVAACILFSFSEEFTAPAACTQFESALGH